MRAPFGGRAVRPADIVAALRRVGVAEGELLLVHVSMRSFGWVEGGAATLVEALLEAVGPGGTLVAVTLTLSKLDEHDPAYDVRTSPSTCGAISREVMGRPDAVRSLHPMSSVACIGPLAEELCAGHEDSPTPCGPGTPYGRIYLMGGKVAFLGAAFSSNSLFHTAEEIADGTFVKDMDPDLRRRLEMARHPVICAPLVPRDKRYLRYRVIPNVRITTADGRELVRDARRYDCYQQGVLRFLDKMEPVYEARGVLRRTTCGEADITVLRAVDDVEVAVDVLAHRTRYLRERMARYEEP